VAGVRRLVERRRRRTGARGYGGRGHETTADAGVKAVAFECATGQRRRRRSRGGVRAFGRQADGGGARRQGRGGRRAAAPNVRPTELNWLGRVRGCGARARARIQNQ
jgi:hypothetical protein